MTYRSKVDDWYYGCMILIALIFILSTINKPSINLITTILCCAIDFLFLGLIVDTKYILNDKALYIYCFIFGTTIILSQQILNIKETKNPIASATLSLNRLEIKYMRENGKPDIILISPKNKKDFLDQLNTTSVNI